MQDQDTVVGEDVYGSKEMRGMRARCANTTGSVIGPMLLGPSATISAGPNRETGKSGRTNTLVYELTLFVCDRLDCKATVGAVA